MPYPAIDFSNLRTYQLSERLSLVGLHTLVSPGDPPPAFDDPELHEVAQHIVEARRAGAPVIWLIGGHVVKRGLSPLLIDLMRRRVITHLASNGAATIHDFEIAMLGCTSEDVATSIEDGSFGMAEETGFLMNRAIRAGVQDRLGMGEALGRWIAEDDRFGYRDNSLLFTAYKLGIPYTAHVALGTDIIHQHPECDFAALGWATGQDFKIFTASVSELEGGVFCNFGSAVIGPEVFLKALSISRNLTGKPRTFITSNFDLMPLLNDYRQPASDDQPEYYYRPKKNIVIRPNSLGGRGYHINGDHRITIPALFHQIDQRLGKVQLPLPLYLEPAPVEETIEQFSIEAPSASIPLRHILESAPELRGVSNALVRAFRLLVVCFATGGTLFVCGNGGSFADALHIAGELAKSFKQSRPIPDAQRMRFASLQGGAELATRLERGFRVAVLGVNPALASAIDNDNPQRYMAFAQEFYALARPGDVLLGITTSGEAVNVYNAALTAKALGSKVIALTGARDSRLATLADITIRAPAVETAEVQNWHIKLYHTLCEMLEMHFFGIESQ